MTIERAAAMLRSREVSAVELAQESLRKIHDGQPSLNAFITVTEDLALEQAKQSDEEFARGIDRGPLQGIPYALKDMFATKGIRTTCGSSIFADYFPDFDAAVYERLTKAGAVLMGKTGLHEFAYGITSNNPHFGAVRNPRDTTRIPGGSSGGSGAAVASGMTFFALGSDTGGSIRIPAAFCGCVGLKPSSGRVSRYGALPLDYSLDHIGPLTRSPRDAALVINAIAGFDRRDDTSSRQPVREYLPAKSTSLRGRTIGVARNFFNQRIEPAVAAAFGRSVERLVALGAQIVEVDLPDPSAVTIIGRVILLSEAAALLGKYSNRREAFGADVIALVDQGRLLAATDYINAQRLRRMYQREWAAVWHLIDALVLPTSPNQAPVIGETQVLIDGELEDVRLASTRFVRCFNVLGNPALSLPFAAPDKTLLTGLQIVGRAFREEDVIAVAAAFSGL